MSKYVIKNCPCLFNSYYASGKTVRFECNDGNHNDKLCRDVTDCLLKRIVEKCRDSKFYLKHYGHPENDGVKNYTLAKEILNNILDIEECE